MNPLVGSKPSLINHLTVPHPDIGVTIKIMKNSKIRGGFTQVKAIFFHINKHVQIYYENKETHAKNIVSGCVVRSEHHVDILNTKLAGKEHLTSSLPFIEKSVSFWD